MLKIGILTYWGTMNIGTSLQAYCTFNEIKKAFPDARVELIDFLTWRSIFRPSISSRSIKEFYNDLIKINKLKKFFKKNFKLSRKKLRSSDYKKSIKFIQSFKYDAIYVGADTLLELDRAKVDSLTGYWLSNAIKCKKFLIAASAKNVTFENMSEIQRNLVKNTIEDFQLLGVRDDSTYRLLNHFVTVDDKRLKIIPDPTFMLDENCDYVTEYIRSKKIDFDIPTICLHFQRTDIWAEKLSGEFKKLGFRIASFRRAKFVDLLLNDLSPLEQFSIYKYFRLVITHRFHDTVFCLLNKTPFITYAPNKTFCTVFGESKYESLIKRFSLNKTNYIKETEKIDDIIMKSYKVAISSFYKNLSLIENEISENRREYLQYLEDTKNYIY